MNFIVRRVSSDIVEQFLRSKVEIAKKSALESFDTDENNDPYMVGIEFEEELEQTHDKTVEKTQEVTSEKHFAKVKKQGIIKHGKSNNKEFERG
jgi:hypothetical protein